MKALRFLFALAIAYLLVAPAAAPAQDFSGYNAEVKQVIIMVPDGMGLADVTATRIRRNAGPGGPPLNLETLEHVGYQRTYSEANIVTDSSAAASAFACGEKFLNNEVCYHTTTGLYNPTLLELAKMKGMATGLVATQTITHATPAAFGAHVPARKCENQIAGYYVTQTQPDVLLGGGQGTFNTTTPTSGCPSPIDYITAAQAVGYTYKITKSGMEEFVATGNGKLLGLFANKNLVPEFERAGKPEAATQPRLPEMTRAALSILERNRAGFFLMVEGSLIDSGNHAENIEYQYGEMAAFDEAVGVVLEWINARADRKKHTLLIVVPDHETGGFAIRGTEVPAEAPGVWNPGWTFTLIPGDPKDFEAHHTGGDIVLWSQGPGTEPLARPIDNTDVYHVVKHALKL